MTRPTPLSPRAKWACNAAGWLLLAGGALGCWGWGLPGWAAFAAGMLAMDLYHVLLN